MKFLVIGRAFNDSQTADFLTLEEAEAKALWELYGAGVLQTALFGKEMDCLSFVFECRNGSEARQFIETLPSFKAEVIDYRISEMSGFANLTDQFKRHHSKLPAWLT